MVFKNNFEKNDVNTIMQGIKNQLLLNVKGKLMSQSSDKQISRQKLEPFSGLNSFITLCHRIKHA